MFALSLSSSFVQIPQFITFLQKEPQANVREGVCLSGLTFINKDNQHTVLEPGSSQAEIIVAWNWNSKRL